jgi:protoporphyrinogen oxidase
MAPVPGKTCLALEYFCFKDDVIWTRSDSALVAQAARELERLGLARASDVEDGMVVRVQKAYPVYDAAYRGHLATIRTFIDRIPNLHTVGRNGMHKYNNQDHSMITAMMTVWNMQGAEHDVWDVNTDFDYHEEQRLDQRAQPAASSRRPAMPEWMPDRVKL